MQIFAKKIAKFAHLAGDGKDKYIRALEIHQSFRNWI